MHLCTYNNTQLRLLKYLNIIYLNSFFRIIDINTTFMMKPNNFINCHEQMEYIRFIVLRTRTVKFIIPNSCVINNVTNRNTLCTYKTIFN